MVRDGYGIVRDGSAPNLSEYGVRFYLRSILNMDL